MAQTHIGREALVVNGHPSTPPTHTRLGPRCIFAGKVRSPVSITLIAAHHVLVTEGMRRLGLSRADFIGLLIDRYADVVEREPARVVGGESQEGAQ